MKIYKLAQSRQVTVQDMGGYHNIVPIIMLRGKWILDANIFPKDKLSVSVSEGTITLSVTEQNPIKREELARLKKLEEDRLRQPSDPKNIIQLQKRN